VIENLNLIENSKVIFLNVTWNIRFVKPVYFALPNRTKEFFSKKIPSLVVIQFNPQEIVNNLTQPKL
jgi:hypothetical protein